jgi:hypothetical protein
LYSLSFAPNPDWHNVFARQPELHGYLRRVVDSFGLRRRLVLGCAADARVAVRLIAAVIGYADAHGLGAVQPTQTAQDAYTAEVERMSEGTVWTAGGCQSWYLNENGRNVNIWPGTTFDFRRRTRRFDPAAHQMKRAVQDQVGWSAPALARGN